LLSIPQGEIAFAVVPMEYEEAASDGPKDNSPDAIRARLEARRNRTPVGAVAIIDTADKAGYMRTIVERLESQSQNSNTKKTVQSVSGTDVATFSNSNGNGPSVSVAERDGVFILGVGNGLVADVLRRWDGDDKSSTLAQSTDFGNVMSHCIGAEDTRPQITFYVDPYRLVELAVKANPNGAGLVWPILESLQIDKIKGVGGSTFAGADEFEGIIHLHVLIESPRDGLFAVVRPGEGSIKPESWVPDDVISYTTLHWDLLKTYEGIGRIVGRFSSADAMEKFVEEPFKTRTDIALKDDVMKQLTGRIGLIRWNEPPMRINSGTQVWAFETKDIGSAEATMEKLTTAFNETLKKDLYAGTTIYISNRGQRGGNLPANFRRPEPTIAIIGNYIIGSDSRKAIEHLIQVNNGTGGRLLDSPDYALIAGEISGKLDAEEPFLFSYIRSEEVFRQLYELIQNPENRQFLTRTGESNPMVKMLSDALEKNQLPAFSAFSKYFAPSGSFAYDDPTGIHYSTFTLKPLE
jgi:hypothetical protein